MAVVQLDSVSVDINHFQRTQGSDMSQVDRIFHHIVINVMAMECCIDLDFSVVYIP